MTPKVYCDMDGVLADFNQGWEDFSGVRITAWITITGDDWGYLQKQWPTFWMDLGVHPYAKALWNILKPYSPDILTAVPSGWKTAGIGKKIWAREHLPGVGNVLAVQRHEKKKYAKQSDGTPNILIDDMQKNIDEWEAAGGLGILYIPSAGMLPVVKREIEQHMKRYGV